MFSMYALWTRHIPRCLFWPSCSAVSSSRLKKKVCRANNALHVYFLVFSLWKSRAPAGWTFWLCRFIWMRLMPTVCFLPLPREMPVDPWLSPEVKMDYCRRTACLALYTFHTHHFSIIRLIHGGKTCTCAHTCPNINTGLKALMGLLAKGHCQDWQIFL